MGCANALVKEGVKLTRANSFQIDNGDPLLLMNLAENLLGKSKSGPG